MKMSYNPEFISDENGCSGFYFNNGGCFEHEHDIEKIKENFGIDSSILGMDGRKVSILPKNITFITFTINKIKRAFLMYSESDNRINKITDLKEIKKFIQGLRELRTKPFDDEKEWVSAAYSNSDFAIYAAGNDNVLNLGALYDALRKKDITMFMGIPEGLGKNPYESGGLIFLIYSKLSEEYKEDVYLDDVDMKRLKNSMESIHALLKENGKKFLNCVPSWSNEEKTIIKYYLRPYDSDNNYTGWVSEQDLLDWIEGIGIIPGHGEKN